MKPERRPAFRLRLGHWLPAILSGAITLAIPALYLSAMRTEEKIAGREATLLQRAASIDAPCAQELARDPSQDLCLCSDFETRTEAEAYVAVLTELGRPPKRRFGLFTDESDKPCPHLPAK